ncbi:WhiB family transcriptional regulator [Rhodococcus sp. NPDC057014]|uniref:WhiB family transcriptional regulator n=1 Tax=Rhodococcus sp. NPDC057014 TaxID=3346000 RepID=UPI003629B022
MRKHFPAVQLPPPRIDEWSWQYRGACRAMPSRMFFPSQNLRGPALRRLESEAKLVCAQCPVIEQCREYALDYKEPYGVWGGLTSAERRHLISNLDGEHIGVEPSGQHTQRRK